MRALVLVLALVSAQATLAAAEKWPVAHGDWSESVEGLRGRLLISQGRVLGDGKTRETLHKGEFKGQ